eukprot:9346428-Alexandrium_andersonii.AAC.1
MFQDAIAMGAPQRKERYRTSRQPLSSCRAVASWAAAGGPTTEDTAFKCCRQRPVRAAIRLNPQSAMRNM